eukprot:sb/3474357/
MRLKVGGKNVWCNLRFVAFFEIFALGAIQEHRIVHAPGEVIRITPAGSDCILLTSTAERNQIGASVGGVGIAMRAAAWKLITEKEVVSPRILMLSFRSVLEQTCAALPVSHVTSTPFHTKYRGRACCRESAKLWSAFQ